MYVYFRLEASQQPCHISIKWRCPLDNLSPAVSAHLPTWAVRGGRSAGLPRVQGPLEAYTPPGFWQVPNKPCTGIMWLPQGRAGRTSVRKAILPLEERLEPFQDVPWHVERLYRSRKDPSEVTLAQETHARQVFFSCLFLVVKMVNIKLVGEASFDFLGPRKEWSNSGNILK